jgi:hypothetical protein
LPCSAAARPSAIVFCRASIFSCIIGLGIAMFFAFANPLATAFQ